jgi:riboflavin kinase/FMN adenylyltransferase
VNEISSSVRAGFFFIPRESAMFAADWKIFGRKDLVDKRASFALSVGNFDGVHIGHRYLLQALKNLAGDLPTAVLTFDPHPSHIFARDGGERLLSPVEDRAREILALGIDVVLVQNFSRDFAALSPADFCESFLFENLNIGSLLLGFDFRFGAQRKGDFFFMEAMGRKHGFSVYQEEAHKVGVVAVSSSEIRRLVAARDMERAELFLTKPFSLAGTIVKGDQRGRILGYPTANLEQPRPGLLLPPAGVYAGLVELDDEGVLMPSVMSFGVRPTFGSGLEYRSEGHIFDFSGDIYGRKARFHIKSSIRCEEKFSDVESLKTQMAHDCERAREILKLTPR